MTVTKMNIKTQKDFNKGLSRFEKTGSSMLVTERSTRRRERERERERKKIHRDFGN